MANGRLESDPLFLGLTRPAMAFGVTYTWFLVEAFVLVIYFINTSDFLGLFVATPILHGVGYFICAKEPRFMDMLIIKSAKCMKCKNARFHGNTQSFDLY